jgi:hypothetical protein
MARARHPIRAATLGATAAAERFESVDRTLHLLWRRVGALGIVPAILDYPS